MRKAVAEEIRRQLWEATDEDVLATTIWLEAGGELMEGKVAVGHVVTNRVAAGRKQYGSEGGIPGVCLRRKQFSCYNDNDPGLAKLTGGIPRHLRSWQASLVAARAVLGELVADPTGGATHYFNPDVCGYPSWSKKMTFKRRIGNHLFYQEV